MTHPRSVPWFGAMQAFKGRYGKLHPSLQMIGLQMWLPLFFVSLFVCCYIGAFHSPAPRAVPVGVAGTAQATALAAGLERADPGGFQVTEVAPARVPQAVAEVRAGTLVALYVAGPGKTATLTYATGNGLELEATVAAVVQGLAAAGGITLASHDLAPLAASDSFGTAALYVALVATIGGYMVGMFTGMMGGPLRRRTRWGIIAAASLLLSLVAAALTAFAIGVDAASFWAVWATMLGTSLAVGLVVDGLGYFFNRFVTGAAIVIFVFLNIPSSGGALPVDFVPQPFRWLSDVTVGPGAIAILRHVYYGAGPGVATGVLRLAAYAVAGLALGCAGPYYAAWRQRRRKLLGLPPGGMMGHAQSQLMELTAAGGPGQEDLADEAVSAQVAGGASVEAEAALGPAAPPP